MIAFQILRFIGTIDVGGEGKVSMMLGIDRPIKLNQAMAMIDNRFDPAGRLEGVYGTNGVEYDLAEAPIPRFDLLDPERYNRLPSGRSAAALGSRSRR